MHIIEKNEMNYASDRAATYESIVHDIGSALGSIALSSIVLSSIVLGSIAAGTVASETGPCAAVAGALGGLVGGWASDAVADRMCGSSGCSESEGNDHSGGSDKGDGEGCSSCHF